MASHEGKLKYLVLLVFHNQIARKRKTAFTASCLKPTKRENALVYQITRKRKTAFTASYLKPTKRQNVPNELVLQNIPKHGVVGKGPKNLGTACNMYYQYILNYYEI